LHLRIAHHGDGGVVDLQVAATRLVEIGDFLGTLFVRSAQNSVEIGIGFFQRTARSARACSMAGDGMVNLGVCFAADFRNLKWSSMDGLVRRIFPVTSMKGGCSSVPLNFASP